jgi:hypothetical protein
MLVMEDYKVSISWPESVHWALGVLMTYLMTGCILLEFWIQHEHFIQRDAIFTWLHQMWRSVATRAADAGQESALAGLGELGGHPSGDVLSLAVSFHFLILIDRSM